ncbi:uncharacterized protein PV06_00411 [Exophiala oligosperma]|uniref:Uncharacterized protein n=1 Tax=Exophiala oligosperma TaxID=215243 RepID=A0A0D2B644_9EURO|nr:uncharacterized protein PV06_00411 [Exophiala oligosperma]KIW47746.1 hypothetical protein PV06_00411 [Exophiala oligosperma]
MSQSAPNAPSVVVNSQNSRQQVPLRDYLNARVAPFLKKAITESLGVEAEFPLQWLGECLIHQSILYEGNPDRTNIRERFQYRFEDPKPQEQSVQQEQQQPPSSEAPPAPEPQAAQAEVPPHAQPEVAMNDDVPTGGEEASTVPGSTAEPTSSAAEAPVVNGTSEQADTTAQETPKDDDTEMGGTS